MLSHMLAMVGLGGDLMEFLDSKSQSGAQLLNVGRLLLHLRHQVGGYMPPSEVGARSVMSGDSPCRISCVGGPFHSSRVGLGVHSTWMLALS